jgi:NADH-quinone oxidoreductase subunit A
MEQIAFLHIFGSLLTLSILLWASTRINAWLSSRYTRIEKSATYESGSIPIGQARGPINSRLYVIGCIFLLFEIETLLLFPWALAWVGGDKNQADWERGNLYMALSGTFLILVLGIGLLYVIKKWKHISVHSIPPTPNDTLDVKGFVPLAYYERINAQYASHPQGLAE